MARKILKALTNNFGFKLLALFFAFILWIVVYNIEDPIKTKTFTTTVTIENASAVTKDMNKWYEIVEGTNQVSFSVSAKRSILEKLDDTDFTATADFNNIVLSDDGTKGSVHVDIACNKSVYNNSLNFNGKVKNLELTLEELMKQQAVRLRTAQRNLDKAREKLNEAVADRKVHEKLKEKAFEEFKAELNNEEKKEIDQLVSFTYNDKGKDTD